MFTAVWGDRADAEWIQGHDAALSDGKPVTGPRIAFLSSASATSNPSVTEGLVAGLREAGYSPGQNITIDWRFSAGHNEVLPSLASELVRLPAGVIVTPSTPESLAAKQATSTIPIVTVSVGAGDMALSLSIEFFGAATTHPEVQRRIDVERDQTLAAGKLAMAPAGSGSAARPNRAGVQLVVVQFGQFFRTACTTYLRDAGVESAG